MSEVFLLPERQMKRIEPFFPLAHGLPRVDVRRVLSGIVYVIRHGLQWKDSPNFRGADVLLAGLFDETEDVIGDRGYDSNKNQTVSRRPEHRRLYFAEEEQEIKITL